MKSIQDILNAFREEIAPYLRRRMDGLETAKNWDLEKVEQFILNTLTEFERETKKKVFKTCGCVKCRSWLTFETLSDELDKEKHTKKGTNE